MSPELAQRGVSASESCFCFRRGTPRGHSHRSPHAHTHLLPRVRVPRLVVGLKILRPAVSGNKLEQLPARGSDRHSVQIVHVKTTDPLQDTSFM